MAEKIISPGVFTSEIDKSFLPAAIGEIGACVIGPTVKGPALVPTVVSSYSEFQQTFGDSFTSGSQNYTYLTSVTAQQYLKHSGKLTVIRILEGTFSQATATVEGGGIASTTTGQIGSGSVAIQTGLFANQEIQIGTVDFTFVSGSTSAFNQTANQIFVQSSSAVSNPTHTSAANLRDAINQNKVLTGLTISASSTTDTVHFLQVLIA
jgi:hypothetical protein